MRQIRDWFRDKSRDELAGDLDAAGIRATMAERGRQEEAYHRWSESLGLIDVAEGPVKWINVVMDVTPRDTTWWYVFGIPKEGDFRPGTGRMELSTVRRRSFPVFGPLKRVEWKGNDGGSGLISALSMVPEVKEFCKWHGDLYIQLHYGTFQGWTVEMRKDALSRQDWTAVESIARVLLSSG